MKISAAYLNDLFSRKIIPLSAWSVSIFNDRECFTIRNSVYCNVFWVDFWYHELVRIFSRQKVITQLQKQDLTLPVIISEEFELLSIPTSLQNIGYYGNLTNNSLTPFRSPITAKITLFIFFISFLFIVFITLFFDNIRNSAYFSLI